MEKRAVLITGASSGIGLETSLHLAQRGFIVYATMRDLAAKGKLESEAARRKLHCRPLQLDVTDTASIRVAVQTVVDQCGGIYGLVNNAGIQLRGYFEDLAEEEIRQVFETNVFGTMAMTRAVLTHMRAKTRGRIVIVTSVGGKLGSLALSAYCSSKFALEGFGESLAQELAPVGVQVILLEPGVIKTEIWETNRGIAKGALDPGSIYQAWFRESERLTDRLVESSSAKPENVARAVYQSLTVRRPKLRYMVGKKARLVMTLRRYLPERFFEKIYFGEVVRRASLGGTYSNPMNQSY